MAERPQTEHNRTALHINTVWWHSQYLTQRWVNKIHAWFLKIKKFKYKLACTYSDCTSIISNVTCNYHRWLILVAWIILRNTFVSTYAWLPVLHGETEKWLIAKHRFQSVVWQSVRQMTAPVSTHTVSPPPCQSFRHCPIKWRQASPLRELVMTHACAQFLVSIREEKPSCVDLLYCLPAIKYGFMERNVVTQNWKWLCGSL